MAPAGGKATWTSFDDGPGNPYRSGKAAGAAMHATVPTVPMARRSATENNP